MKISAIVDWRLDEGDFLKNGYSRAHTWQFDGGVRVPASSSPDVVKIPLSDPSAVDPEEAYVASLSSCHMLWFLAVASKKGFIVTRYCDNAIGKMTKNDAGKQVISHVVLRPDIDWGGERFPDDTEISQMHHEAHEECFIANSVKTEIVVEAAG